MAVSRRRAGPSRTDHASLLSSTASSDMANSLCMPSDYLSWHLIWHLISTTRHAACAQQCGARRAQQRAGSTAATPSFTARRCAPVPRTIREPIPHSASPPRGCPCGSIAPTSSGSFRAECLRRGQASPCRIPNGWRLGAASAASQGARPPPAARTRAASASSRPRLLLSRGSLRAHRHLHARRGARQPRRPDGLRLGRRRRRHRHHRRRLRRPPRAPTRGERRARKRVRARACGHMCGR